ncbi:MAG: hypothetical protein V3R73_04090, partial [Sphingomonadales bacterium]
AATAKARREGLEAMLVTARADESSLPGYKQMTYGPASGNWQLTFGGLGARFSFVRQLPDGGYENLRSAVFPERIHLALMINTELSLDEIPVKLKMTGLKANKPAKIALTLKKVAGQKGLYLSGPLDLHGQKNPATRSGGLAIAVGPGRDGPGHLEAGIDPVFINKSFQMPVTPRAASVAVRRTAQEGNYEWTWHSAIKRAAACHAGVQIEDWHNLSFEKSERIWNLIILSRTEHVLRQEVSFGEHAAAILMRDMLLLMMDKQVKELEGILGNRERMQGLINYLSPLAQYGEFPYNEIEVKALNGQPLSWKFVLWDSPEAQAKEHDVSVYRIIAWQMIESRRAVTMLLEAGRKTMETARDAGDCKVKDLVRLTGFGFEAVKRMLKPELVTLIDVKVGGELRHEWKPDELARFWLDELAPLAEAVRQQQIAANIDTDLVLAAVAMASLPFMFAESTAAVLFAFALDLTDLAITGIHEISQYEASQKEIEFALGAVTVIGFERYEKALEDEKGWASTAFGVGTSLFGAAIGGIQALPALVKSARMARARALMRTLKADELEALAMADKQDFGMFAMAVKAHARTHGIAALTVSERRVLELAEEYKALGSATKKFSEPELPVNLVDTNRPARLIEFEPDPQDLIGTVRLRGPDLVGTRITPPPKAPPGPEECPTVRVPAQPGPKPTPSECGTNLIPAPPRAGSGGGAVLPEIQIKAPVISGKVPNSRQNRIAKFFTEIVFKTKAGVETMRLGEWIAAGTFSEIFKHADDPKNLVIRATRFDPESPATEL